MAREELKNTESNQICGGLIVYDDGQYYVIDENTGISQVVTPSRSKAENAARMLNISTKVITREEYNKMYSPNKP